MQNHKILWTFGSKYSRGSTLFIIKNRRQSRVIAGFSVLVLFALTYAVFNPIYVEHDGAYAVTGSATAATTSLTLSSSNNSANVAITPKSANGTFAMSSAAGEAQFGVTTNNFTGYELSIVADDDSGNLTNTDGNAEHSIFSIDTPMTKDSFDTTTYNNRWGYKPSKYVSNNVVIDNTGDSAVFLPSPTTTGTILDHTTVANSSANNYSIALGVRADYNTYSGSYAKAFKLQVTANPASYTINFNKNTADVVANMPTTQSSASVSATSIALANNAPSRDSYNFIGWCNAQPTTNNGVDSCPGTTFQPGAAYGIDQTTANITTLYAMWEKSSVTCTKQFRLQNIDGTYPDAYTPDGTVEIQYGGTCTYTKSVDYYVTQTASASNMTSNQTVSVSLPRTTYQLTITKGDNIDSVTASGQHRWGEEINLTATKATDNSCATYGNPVWTKTAGTLSSTVGANVKFTMPQSAATVTVSASKTNKTQTITLRYNNGGNRIKVDGGSEVTSSSTYLQCGTHTVSGVYLNGFEFNSWSGSDGVSVANPSSDPATITVSGPGTLTLNGKASGVTFAQAFAAAGKSQSGGYYLMQDMTTSICQNTKIGDSITLKDGRDGKLYSAMKVYTYSTSAENMHCWMSKNLDLAGGTTVTPSNSNVTANYTLPASARDKDAFGWNNQEYVYNSNSTNCSSDNGCYSYYSFAAATATTGVGLSSGDAPSDICPKGWRLPTKNEYTRLVDVLEVNKFGANDLFQIVYNGSITNNNLKDNGTKAYYQSSTVYSSDTTHFGYFSASTYNTARNSNRQGNGIRCIAK